MSVLLSQYALFPVGVVVITHRALACICPGDVARAVRRHAIGDWGMIDQRDWAGNAYALRKKQRLFSAYISREGTEFWVVTEGDRSRTTVLLPGEC